MIARFIGWILLLMPMLFAAPEISYLIEKPGETLNEIMARPQSDFKPYQKGAMGFGFTRDVYWLRIALTNALPSATPYVIGFDYTTLDRIDMYETRHDRLLSHHIYGDLSDNTVAQSLPIFFHKTQLEPHETKIYFARVQTQGSMILELTIQEADHFYAHTLKENVAHYLYYGITLGLLLYNMFLFIGLRDRTFLYYVLFHFWFFLLQLSITGFGSWLVWNDLYSVNSFMIPLSMFMASLFASLFAHHFLSLGHNLLRKIAWVHVPLLILPFVLPFWLATTIAIFISSLAAFVVLGGAVAGLIRSDNKQAKFFLLAWGGLLVGVLLQNFKNTGVLPVTLFTTYGTQFGAVFEMLLLSAALVRKYTSMQKTLAEQTVLIEQKESYNAKLLHQSRTDMLTGLYNRRYFFEAYGTFPEPRGAFLMMDLDYFKLINDTYGHAAGDAVLSAFALHTMTLLPKEALFCRFGGEEFAAFIPDIDAALAMMLAQTIVEATRTIVVDAFPDVALHVSIGVAPTDPSMSIDVALNHADHALYQAKASGRDQALFFSTS